MSKEPCLPQNAKTLINFVIIKRKLSSHHNNSTCLSQIAFNYKNTKDGNYVQFNY